MLASKQQDPKLSMQKKATNGQSVDKNLVSKCFDLASKSYDMHANVQKNIANFALALSQDYLQEQKLDCIADLGCGTGSSYERLAQFSNAYMGIDISQQMLANFLQKTQQTNTHDFSNVIAINADAESLPIKSSSVDFVYSSMALQWCQSTKQAISEIQRILKPRASAVLAIMTGESFSALHNAWHVNNLPSRVNKFYSSEDWIKTAEALDLQVAAQTKTFISQHESVLSMLKSIKVVGANAVTRELNDARVKEIDSRPSTYISKNEIASLSKYLQNMQNKPKRLGFYSEGFYLDYQVVFLKIKKTN